MIALPAFLTTLAFRIGASVAVVALLVGSCALRDAKIANRGAEKAVAKIEKSNAQAVKTVDRARAASRDDGMRGKRDPYSID